MWLGSLTWEDLQFNSSDLNNCQHTPAGFAPLTVTSLELDAKRIPWGIHSLCQHTVEAYVTQFGGAVGTASAFLYTSPPGPLPDTSPSGEAGGSTPHTTAYPRAAAGSRVSGR